MADEVSPRSEGDLDPDIWKNKTLGAAGAGPFLPEIEIQVNEDRNARHEGREPNVVEYLNRYPTMPESGSVPSVRPEIQYISPRGDVISEFPPAVDNETTEVPEGENPTEPVTEEQQVPTEPVTEPTPDELNDEPTGLPRFE